MANVTPVDPAAVAFLAERAHIDAPPDHRLSVEEMRERADLSTTHLDPDLPVGTVDRDLVGPGGTLPVRVHTPWRRPAGVVVYAHGGGHVTGTLDSYDRLTRRLAAVVPATVVLVGYRLAPEHRWPAAVDDVEAAYHWAVRHRSQLAFEGAGIAIAGDSAGGHLAAVVCRRLRDKAALVTEEQARRQDLLEPSTQVLVYPTLDAVAYRQAAYGSHRECATGYGLEYVDGLAYWDHYLGPDGDPASPDASALQATDLAGLPAALILTSEYDVLRDEGRAYADRLRAAGASVSYHQYDGQLHGFLGDPDRYRASDEALRAIADHLRRRLAG